MEGKKIRTVVTAVFMGSVLFASSLFAQVERSGRACQKPSIDPFRRTIMKRVRPQPQTIVTSIVNPVLAIPQLKLQVLAIAGEPSNFVAVVKYKGKEEIIEKGYEPSDKSFKVYAIKRDSIEVFHEATQSRREFPF